MFVGDNEDVTIDKLEELLAVAGYEAGDQHDAPVRVVNLQWPQRVHRIHRVYSPDEDPETGERVVVIEIS